MSERKIFSDELIDPARDHYDPRLMYHNWQHAQAVMDQALLIAERVIKRGYEVDLDVLTVAGAWHDAGYGDDHEARGFQTKEEYSVYLATKFLREKALPELFIRKVGTAILGTIHNGVRDDLTTLVLHRADIANIGGPYEAFYIHSTNLYHENELFGNAGKWPDWVTQTRGLIDKLMREARTELVRIGEPTDDGTSFPSQAFINGLTLANEDGPYT